jgi:hypothetical protein
MGCCSVVEVQRQVDQGQLKLNSAPWRSWGKWPFFGDFSLDFSMYFYEPKVAFMGFFMDFSW